VLRDRGQHGRLVELEIGREWHAHEIQALQLRAQRVHHEAGHGCEHGGALARLGAGQGQQGDEFVRAVAQHDAVALGHAGVLRQRGLQVVQALARVAVERQRAQALAQRSLQVGG